MSDSNIKISLEIGKMTCAACAISIESMLKSQKGIINASVNYANHSVLLEYNSKETDLINLKKLVNSIGYELYIEELSVSQKEENELKRFTELRKKLIIATFFSLPVFIISMFFHHAFNWENYLLLALSLPVITYSGAEFYKNAYKQLSHRMANMDTLVALGTGTAFIYSLINTFFAVFFILNNLEVHQYYESAVVIITLILLGRFLEERAKTSASSAIKKLMDLQPKEITVVRNGNELLIPIKEVLINDLILIKPGEKIPVDGIVTNGESFIDESMITGEAIPVIKNKNAKVFAGTINQNSILTIIAKKIGNETLLSQIIRLVQEAQASKPPIQKLADKISGIFVPIVICIALLTFSIWFFATEANLAFAISATISVLIIACPCALGLATPTALMVGIGKAAEKGILIKNARQLEIIHKVNAIVFDKTGTITIGKPEVIEFLWQTDYDNSENTAVLNALEKRSAHPLAEAIVNHFKDTRLPYTNISDFKNFSGKGIQGIYDKELYYAGNLKYMIENQVYISTNQQDLLDRYATEGNTLILFACNTKLLAIIAIADKIKENAAETISKLKTFGIKTYLLTGDNLKTAQIIANRAGIENVKAEVLPSEKADFIRKLQQNNSTIAMVGDGINDSIALSQADIGIAMAHGSDIAMESAGITLINSDIRLIVSTISLSEATLKTIHQNLFWAFFYNIITIPVAAGILYPLTGFLLNPMIAAAAMALSSVTVVGNSLRLKKQ